MIPELGHFALWVALVAALAQSAFGLLGAWRADARLMGAAERATTSQFVLVALAFACLAASFVGNDFSVLNVAANSNSRLPTPYRFAATWGSHEGSILLWSLMLAAWSGAVVHLGRGLSAAMRARVVGVLGLIAVGFLAFILFTSNPFERLIPPAPDGRDLNPLLQDPGMVIHPPMLYMGYVGFSVAFAFAIAAMIGGRVDAAWTRWARPWTLAAWMFLTVGIALGSGWAYYELGWGGWWFWDPVENASFMPWLVGTALIHSLIVTELRGSFKAWTLLLAIATFSLSLLGTFLVRSGVLTSVHAFATDPARGIFILLFLVAVIGGSLALFAWRGPSLTGNTTPTTWSPSSREGYLLANNLLMTVAAAAVFLGTMYPLLLDTLDMGKISVGPPYFDSVFVPLMAPALFLMGVGPFARWRTAPVPELALRLRWAFIVALIVALAAWLVSGRIMKPGIGGALLFALGLFIGIWVICASIAQLLVRLRHGSASVTQRLASSPASFYGMLIAHVGVGVFCIGVASVNTLAVEADEALAPGQSMELAGYRFTLNGLSEHDGPNYRAYRGEIDVTTPGGAVLRLQPEKRRYSTQQAVMTEAAIRPGLTRDIYVSLGEPLPDGRWTLKTWIKPFVDWIWAGCLLMAIGALFSLCDRRYRRLRVPRAREQWQGSGAGPAAVSSNASAAIAQRRHGR